MKLRIVFLSVMCVTGIARADEQVAQISSFTLRTPIEICGTWTGEMYQAHLKATETLLTEAQRICSPNRVNGGMYRCQHITLGKNVFFQDFTCVGEFNFQDGAI